MGLPRNEIKQNLTGHPLLGWKEYAARQNLLLLSGAEGCALES